MLGPGFTIPSLLSRAPIAQVSETQVDVFDELYLVFLVLGTIVGVIVIAYTIYNAYKYRTESKPPEGRYDIDEQEFSDEGDDVARPRRGEIPSGQGKGGGKKLFLSFGISAVLVLGLIIYSYSLLLYVEDTDQQENAIEVQVTGVQFDWVYEYPGGHEQGVGEPLVVPEGSVTQLNVTSDDVFHNYGIPEFRAKTDAIPGHYTTTWFQPEETGSYEAICYELCGAGHSNMIGEVIVMEQDEFAQWCAENDCMDSDELQQWQASMEAESA